MTASLPELRYLLSTSVTSRDVRGRDVLIYSECLRSEWPNILAREAGGRLALAVCLEREHISHITAKLATMIIMGKPASMTVLTVDGSPHCVQVHFALQQALRITGLSLPVRHLVVEKGAVYEVSPEAIRTARHLSEVVSLMRKR